MSVQQRHFSQIDRRVVAGQPVYVKRCLPGPRYTTPELVRSHLARVVDLLQRFAQSPDVGGRLGVLQIVAHDTTDGTISTAEVSGALLADVVRRANRRTLIGSCTRAFFVAGKWLRVLQSLPIFGETTYSDTNPQDFVEHCDLRMKRLMELGHCWPNAESRNRVLQWLDEQIAATPNELRRHVWCHGDFGPFNMIWDGRRLTPIDFEACAQGFPLSDLVYLIHCLEMLPVELPWRWWPVHLWRAACLRGYGMPRAERLPIYKALRMRCLLSRLKNLVQSDGKTRRQRIHDRWCRGRVQSRLVKLINEST